MIKTEIRGEHATGFWSTAHGNKVYYHKEPVKASLFVQKSIWKELANCNSNLLLGHCRWTSPGGGSEKVNKNNHPHVSKDYRVALVHNGRILEYQYLKKNYPINSDCDSEVLLRIFESAEECYDQEEFLRSKLPNIKSDTSTDLLYRIYGLKKIFSEIQYGAMSVAIAERLNGKSRSLFLFHNEQRPLVMVDLRSTLGQIFFCSTPEIFRAAVDSSQLLQNLIPKNQAVLPLPENLIYSVTLQEDNEFALRRFRVQQKWRYGSYDSDDKEEIKQTPKSEKKPVYEDVQLKTMLNENDEVEISNIVVTKPSCSFDKYRDLVPKTYKGRTVCAADSNNVTTEGWGVDNKSPSEWNGKDLFDEVATDSTRFEDICKEAIKLLNEIDTHVHNAVQEGSMKQEELDDAISHMEETLGDLVSSKVILGI